MIKLPLADFKDYKLNTSESLYLIGYPTVLSAFTLLEYFYFIHFIPLLHCVSRAIIVFYSTILCTITGYLDDQGFTYDQK